jgi:hypothetical protein
MTDVNATVPARQVDTSLPRRAAAYVWIVIALGAAIAGSSWLQWQPTGSGRWAALLVLGIVAGVLKARLPGISGTYSASFVIIVAAIPAFSLAEIVVLAAATAVVQNLWRPARAVKPVQVLFNVANLIVSAAIAHSVYVRGEGAGLRTWPAALLVVAAITYWFVNTGTLSVLMALLGEGSVVGIWQRWCLYSLPFHLAGVAVAILMSSPLQHGDWVIAVFFAPVITLGATCYRMCIDRVAT